MGTLGGFPYPPLALLALRRGLFLLLALLLEQRAVLGGAAVPEAVGAELVDQPAVIVGRLDDQNEGVVPLALVAAIREQVPGVGLFVEVLGDAGQTRPEGLGVV